MSDPSDVGSEGSFSQPTDTLVNTKKKENAVNLRQPSTSRKAKTLWKLREAKANGEEYYDQGGGRQIESRVAWRQAMQEKHLQSPVSALEDALRRTEAGGSLNVLCVSFEPFRAPFLFLR